jgi:hypothetical protein
VNGEVGGGQAAVLAALAAALDLACGQHPRPDLRGRLGVGGAGELLGGEALGRTYRSMRSSSGPDRRLA